jgi:hypothetical protein
MHQRRIFLQSILVAISLSTFLFLPGNCHSQTSMADRERQRALNERDLNQRAWNLRMVSLMAARKRAEPFDPERALSQVQDDFKELQLLNKPLALMALGKTNFDLKLVTKFASEINKRAERLMKNLALPGEPEVSPRKYEVTTPGQLKAPLVHMANLILDFTGNPFFKDAGVVDEQAYKARRDLEEIIELSGRVRDFSKKLAQ